MRPQPSRVFRTNAASRLDDVELIAALLERDATKAGAVSIERGVRVASKRRRVPSVRYRMSAKGAKIATAGRGIAKGTRHVVLDPRLFYVLDATGGFLLDLMIVLGAGAATLAVLIGGVLLAAPPI
jgi:hypothetical protein